MKTKIIFTLLFIFSTSYFYSQSDNSSLLKEIKIKCENIKINLESYTQVSKEIDSDKITAYYNGDDLVMVSKKIFFPDYTRKLSYLYDNNKLIYIRKTDITETTLIKKDIVEYFFNNGKLLSAFNKNKKLPIEDLNTHEKEMYVNISVFKNLLAK